MFISPLLSERLCTSCWNRFLLTITFVIRGDVAVNKTYKRPRQLKVYMQIPGSAAFFLRGLSLL